jgi:flavin reductase (DIM6/NTAB) family NADH-FMN oxidoreductase RutF
MPVTPQEFKATLRRFASGVTVVTACDGKRRHGMTVSAFASVSAVPPLVLVCLERGTRTHALVTETRRFGVSLLAESERATSDRFAGLAGEQEDRFAGVACETAPGGPPVLTGALAWLDCAVVSGTDAGSHTVFVGQVEACRAVEGRPLVYYDGRYRKLE